MIAFGVFSSWFQGVEHFNSRCLRGFRDLDPRPPFWITCLKPRNLPLGPSATLPAPAIERDDSRVGRPADRGGESGGEVPTDLPLLAPNVLTCRMGETITLVYSSPSLMVPKDAGHRTYGRRSGRHEDRPIVSSTPLMPAVSAPSSADDTREQTPLSEPTPGPRVSILAVDDQPANLLALDATLSDMDLNLVKAASGFEALRHLLDADFALILMDVKMPGMDGFETAELIHRRKRSRHTPIIFLTAIETADTQVFKGYVLGAVDYLVKPIIPEVLRAKVTVFVDIYRKTAEIHRQAELLRRLEEREHQRQLAEAHARWEAERLHEEIRIARQIQQRLFPAAPLPLPGLDIAGASFPAEATGGDYFDYIPTADKCLAVVVGDVCGHGFGPALLMAELRAYLRAFLLTRSDVSEVLRLLNTALTGDTDRFVTLLIAKLDPLTRRLWYAGAGHLPGYILGSDGSVKARLESTGLPLAVLADSDYTTEKTEPLNPGELILFLTDGIVEAHGPDENLFGTERVLQLVRENRHCPARAILNTLYGVVRDFCGSKAQLDDMTAIIIKVE